MQFQKSITIAAGIEYVFATLLSSQRLWKATPGLSGRDRTVIRLEPKIGGRISATWPPTFLDQQGALLGTFVELDRPQAASIAGPLGLAQHCGHGIARFTLQAAGDATDLTLHLHASGIFDNEAQSASEAAWQDFLQQLKTIAETPPQAPTRDIAPLPTDVDVQPKRRHALRRLIDTILSPPDPETLLDHSYQGLQNKLIEVRQQVAHAIGSEMALNNQLQRNADQAATWQSRASTAVQQNNDQLARQAISRKHQYDQAVADSAVQLGVQKEATIELRKQLTDLESAVQGVYIRKQVLAARYRTATASSKALDIIADMPFEQVSSALDRMEAAIAQREQAADQSLQKVQAKLKPTSDDLLARAISTLDRAVAIIERLEGKATPPQAPDKTE